MSHKIELKDEIYGAIKMNCLDAFHGEEAIELSELSMRLMDTEGVPMHYPYHHFIVPAALLTAACKELGTSEDEFCEMLDIAEERAKNILGGFCGNYGACGSGVGAGIFMSVLTQSSPMSEEIWQWANEITGISLQKISEIPGPRCCKRTGYLALQAAVPYANEKLSINMQLNGDISCKYHTQNKECKRELCPFFPVG